MRLSKKKWEKVVTVPFDQGGQVVHIVGRHDVSRLLASCFKRSRYVAFRYMEIRME